MEHLLSETGRVKKVSLTSSNKTTVLATRLECLILIRFLLLFYIRFIPPFLLINYHRLFYIQFSLHRHFHHLLGYLAFHKVKIHRYKSCNGRNQKNAALLKYMGINITTTRIISTLFSVYMFISQLTFLCSYKNVVIQGLYFISYCSPATIYMG